MSGIRNGAGDILSWFGLLAATAVVLSIAILA
jgi:hypothetical protein